MQTIEIKGGRFKYSLIEHPDDVTTLPLTYSLFGLNNRIYANLASLPMTDEHKEQLKGKYTEHELRFPLFSRLFEIHIHTRTEGDDYDHIEKIDFQELYDFIKDKHGDFRSVHAQFYDDDISDEERGVLHIPLGAKVLMNASNYAYQEIERFKMDNFMDTFKDSKHLNNFLNIF